jgi:hypothetical protein
MENATMSILDTKMNEEQQAAARSLAVAYNAYNRCRGKDDDQGTVVWGESLRIAQQETGVHLHGDNLIDSIKRARRQIAEDRTLESYRLADEARAARHAAKDRTLESYRLADEARAARHAEAAKGGKV